MISSQVSSVLNRLRGQGADFEFLADVLQDALAASQADFVGQMRIEMDERQIGAEVQPPNKPNLEHDLPTPLTVVNNYAFFKPEDEGPSGGYSMRIIGPMNITPNREDDVVFDGRDGTLIIKRLILNGVEVILEDC
jgi:hypothetical protein